jgi:mannose-6-phosphate isomerase-like protein (cupin superfamily)
MLKLDDVLKFIHNPLSYEQKLVSIINEDGLQLYIESYNQLYSGNNTIKVEGMEKYSKAIFHRCKYYNMRYHHDGPVTCHAFIAQKDSPSFGTHTDPDDVIILCCEGVKTLTINNEYIVLKEGDEVYIPANTPHCALNEHAAFTLSFGLEKYLMDKAKNYELDVIS